MARCVAFRKTDCAPCQNFARNGYSTCSSHKRYYDKEHWKQLFFSLDSPLLPTGLDYPQTSTPGRIQAAVQYAIENNLVVLTQEDCAEIPCPPPGRFSEIQRSAVDLWTILVRTGKVNPRWNNTLTKFTLFTFALMREPSILDIAPPLEKHLGSFLRHPNMCPQNLLMNVLAFEYLICRRKRYSEESKDFAYKFILQEFLSHEGFNDCLLLSNEVLLKNLETCPETLIPQEIKKKFQTFLTSSIAPFRKNKRAFHHEHVEKFKEELTMVVFHPDRVGTWLKEGGWDLVESMFGAEKIETAAW
jgi:hypothetical protein